MFVYYMANVAQCDAWSAGHQKPMLVTGREKPMAMRTCLNCVYVCCDPNEWLRCHLRGEPLVPQCANHPQWPGELHDVPGVPCRNYQPKPPEPKGDIRRIPLNDGQFAIVDAADYERLSQHNWRLENGYAVRHENGKRVFMHRDITQAPEGMVVDHINRNKLENCQANLRVCTRQENVRNRGRHAGSSSVFKGVGYRKHNHKWYAEICFQGERIWRGYFNDEAEAARVYDRMAVEFFGPFAYLNFPAEWPPERRQQVYADAQPLRDALKAKADQAKTQEGKGRKGKSKKAKGKSVAPHAKTAEESRRKARVARKT